MNNSLRNRAVVALAEIAEVELAALYRLSNSDAAPEAIEEAEMAVNGLALALARLPATNGPARAAKARAAARLIGPIHSGAALTDLSSVDAALAAAVLSETIAATKGIRR